MLLRLIIIYFIFRNRSVLFIFLVQGCLKVIHKPAWKFILALAVLRGKMHLSPMLALQKLYTLSRPKIITKEYFLDRYNNFWRQTRPVVIFFDVSSELVDTALLIIVVVTAGLGIVCASARPETKQNPELILCLIED